MYIDIVILYIYIINHIVYIYYYYYMSFQCLVVPWALCVLGFHVGFRFGDRQRQKAGQPRHFSHMAPLGCLGAILNSQVIS